MPQENQTVAPILVLALGNVLLGDDGVGPELLERVRQKCLHLPQIDFVDGGTQGLALLGYLENRESVVILDACSLGAAAGEVCVLQDDEIFSSAGPRSTTAHEGNAGELLAAARLLGQLPPRVVLVGVEPESVRTGLGLSETVSTSLPLASALVSAFIENLLARSEQFA